MYILKNAITSIRRNKGRNILIGIILIVIAVSCTITLAIRSSAEKIVKAYEEKNPIESTIEMNRQSLMSYLRDGDKSQEEMINAFNDIKAVTEEEINNYGNSDYVKEYYYTYSLGVDAKDLTEATDSLVKENTEENKTETTAEENKAEETTEESKAEEASTEKAKKDEKYNFGLANVSEVNTINAVVNFKVLAELLLIGISLTLLSSLATMIAISRFSPLTILKERS